MIIKNGKEVTGVFKGNTPVLEIYKGNKLVWHLGDPVYDTNGYDYVDMGDAGIWCTHNIGASRPEEGGLFFAWGETQGYTPEQVKNGEHTFNWASYKFGGNLFGG